jgi:hypothetical protein
MIMKPGIDAYEMLMGRFSSFAHRPWKPSGAVIESPPPPPVDPALVAYRAKRRKRNAVARRQRSINRKRAA